MRAGHVVTPSEEVDEVWHLHLVYTESYWKRLCGEVLGKPLHHHPTRGGLTEGTKFRDFYQQTLDSYAEYFGGEAPGDLWPPSETRFTLRQMTRVDLGRHWLLPRPRVPRFFRQMAKPAFALGLIVLGFSALLTGCVSQALDLHGAAFLTLFVMLMPVAFVLSFLLGRFLVPDGPTILPERITDPYSIAFLGGGPQRHFQAILARFFEAGLVDFTVSNKSGGKVKRTNKALSTEVELSPAENRCLSAIPVSSYESVADVRSSLKPVFDGLKEDLSIKGLLLTQPQRFAVQLVAGLPVLVLIALGIAKIFVGLSRDKPVLFLLFLLIACVVFLVLRLTKVRRRTKAGETMWQQLQSQEKEVKQRLATSQSDDAATMIPLAVALMGTSAMASASADFRTYEKAMTMANSGGTNSSGGCGAGCGSGCGGGGCGGCGGCGG